LLAKAVAHSTSPSQMDRFREQARSHRGFGVKARFVNIQNSVGAELARDSGGSACMDAECAAVIASKLGSHRVHYKSL